MTARNLGNWDRSATPSQVFRRKKTYKLLGLLITDRRSDNHIITWDPVDWGGDAVLVTSLERVYPGISNVFGFLESYSNIPTIRRTSAELRPVEAGYWRMVRIFFFGSMIKTERMVNAMPLESTLVASWWSILRSHQKLQTKV